MLAERMRVPGPLLMTLPEPLMVPLWMAVPVTTESVSGSFGALVL